MDFVSQQPRWNNLFMAVLLLAGSGRRPHLQRQPNRMPTCDHLLSVISNDFVLIIIIIA